MSLAVAEHQNTTHTLGQPSSERTRIRKISRVTTGCRTCKARRVKCDEAHPACRRCTSSGRKCAGYGAWNGEGYSRRFPAQLLRLYHFSDSNIISQLSPQDSQMFQWFSEATIIKLRGLFPAPFWEYLVPETCRNEPVILHCCLALGSAHRGVVLQHASLGASPQPHTRSAVDDLRMQALSHYNKAMQELSAQKPSVRVMLISCLVFISIENLLQHQDTGRFHLQNGLQIVQQELLNTTSPTDAAPDPVDDWIIEAFGRLGIQERLLSNNPVYYQLMTDGYVDRCGQVSVTSIHGARVQLDQLLSRCYSLQKISSQTESSDPVVLFESIVAQQDLRQDLIKWLHTYEGHRGNWSSWPILECIALELLIMYQRMASIMTAVVWHPEGELAYDQHTLQFEKIIASGRDVLEHIKGMGKSQEFSHYTSVSGFIGDIGVVFPLYYTALKCRVGHLRRQAIALLSSATDQEGIWDGLTAGLIASEVMRLEEHGDNDHNSPFSNSPGLHTYHIAPRLQRLSDVEVVLLHRHEGGIVFEGKQRTSSGSINTVQRRYDDSSQTWSTPPIDTKIDSDF